MDQNKVQIKAFRLLDDFFMRIVFHKDLKATQAVLRIILENDKLIVTEAKGQYDVTATIGKYIHLDIYAEDDSGVHYNIEVQIQEQGAGPKRARYNSAMLDTEMLKSGEKTGTLKDSYVIFICETDILQGGRPVYHIDRTIQELGQKPFDDGSHIIFVNCEYESSDPIGDLIHDFKCRSANDMRIPALRNRVKFLKETKGGQEVMTDALKEFAQQNKEEGQQAVATNMLKKGLDHETVAEYSMLSIEKVEELARSLSA